MSGENSGGSTPTGELPNAKQSSEGDEDAADESGATTTSPRYRWKGLSTLVSLFLVVFYPAFLVVQNAGYLSAPDGTVMGVLTFSWLVAIAYAVGTDIMKDVQEIRGG